MLSVITGRERLTTLRSPLSCGDVSTSVRITDLFEASSTAGSADAVALLA